MLCYIRHSVGNLQTIGYNSGWQYCTQVLSGQIGRIQSHCNVVQFSGRWPSTKSLTEDYIHSFFGKCHWCLYAVNLLM